MQENEYFTMKEAGQYLLVSPWTIAAWLTQKKLTRYKAGGRTLIAKRDIERLLRVDGDE